MGCSRRTLYSYINDCVFDVRNGDLRRSVRYKKRKKPIVNSYRKEITFWRIGDGKNLKSTVLAIAQKFSQQTFIPIRYKDCIQIRFHDHTHDKSKYTFKVNHGDILYRKNTKQRISKINDPIQIYEEKKNDWKLFTINTTFNVPSKILSLYYKEIYQTEIKIDNCTYKIIGHSLMFLDSNINPVSCMEYIEIESDSINNNHVTYFTNQLSIHNFKPLDMEHCKINMGQQFIDIDFEKFYCNNEHFRDIIYSIFIQNTIVKFLE